MKPKLILVCLAFALSLNTQHALANGEATGDAAIILTVKDPSGTTTLNKSHYLLYTNWSAGCETRPNATFSNTDFGTIGSLILNGHSIVGWVDTSNDWVASMIEYRIWKTSETEPLAWTNNFKIGNYNDAATTVADVRCYNGNNRYVIIDNQAVDITATLTPGTYNFKVSCKPKVKYSGGSFNLIIRPDVTATFTYQPSYRAAQIINGTTTYSNTLTTDGTFSFFAKAGSPIILQKQNADNSWSTISGMNITPLDTNAVITTNFTYNTQVLGAAQKYTGNYYIRSAVASGGMNNYLNTSYNNAMTAFTPKARIKGDLFDDSYNHYWVTWYSVSTTKPNLTATVANQYNPNLSNTVGDYTLNYSGNIRYSYDSSTNTLERVVVGGGTSIKSGGIVMTDKGNWTFSNTYICKSNTPATTKISASHEYTATDTITLKSFSSLGHAGKQIVFEYDFKTNSLNCTWSTPVPTSATPSPIIDAGLTDLDAHVLVFTNQYGIPKITLEGTVKGRINTTRSYTVADMTNWQWISFPYDIKVNSIIGLDSYGTKWVIAKYDSFKRAHYGLNISANWQPLTANDTLFACQGYILGFDNSAINLVDPNTVTLVFPSTKNNILLNKTDRSITRSVTYPNIYTESTLPTSGEYAKANQNWYLIGSPLLSKIKIHGPEYVSIYKGKALGYDALKTANTILSPLSACFVQYAGTIEFTQQTNQSLSPPAYNLNTSQNLEIELSVTSGEYTNSTTVILADNGSIDYEYNRDFQKMLESGVTAPQLYTICNNEKLAFNHLPKEIDVTVPIGLVVGKSGEHTFHVTTTANVELTLFDTTDNQYHNLGLSDYTTTLNSGSINDRFILTAHLVPNITTDQLIESEVEPTLFTTRHTTTLNNLTVGTKITMYDLSGKICFSTCAKETQIILPQISRGVYLIHLQTSNHTIIIKHIEK